MDKIGCKIIVTNAEKRYKKNKVLKNVSFEFIKGKIYSIIGDNGAGKTTLVSAIAGVTKLDKGSINFKNVNKNPFLLLSGERNLYFKNTVRDNFTYLGAVYGKREKEILENIKTLKGIILKIEDLMPKRVEHLSYGQKRKVALGIALCCSQDIIIIDEAVEGLDQKAQEQIIEVLKAYSSNKIIILISHDLNFVAKVSDEILVIKEGELVDTMKNINPTEIHNMYENYYKGE